MSASQWLMTVSASILAILGAAHLLLTYRGPKLLPRDRSLQQAMRDSAPVITTQTNIWRMWIGFNASHSMGAMLFGLVYGYLAQAHPQVLFQSIFLQTTGFLMLAGFTALAHRYWFITPLLGSAIALACYLAALALA